MKCVVFEFERARGGVRVDGRMVGAHDERVGAQVDVDHHVLLEHRTDVLGVGS